MTQAGSIVPGDREPFTLMTFGTFAASAPTIPEGPSTMDAVTIAERQREGGGAPSQRRPVRTPSRRKGPGLRLQQFVSATRALFSRRLRTTHV